MNCSHAFSCLTINTLNDERIRIICFLVVGSYVEVRDLGYGTILDYDSSQRTYNINLIEAYTYRYEYEPLTCTEDDII